MVLAGLPRADAQPRRAAARRTPRPPRRRPAADAAPEPGETTALRRDPYPSTYKPLPSRPTLIRNATVLTAAGPAIEGGLGPAARRQDRRGRARRRRRRPTRS